MNWLALKSKTSQMCCGHIKITLDFEAWFRDVEAYIQDFLKLRH